MGKKLKFVIFLLIGLNIFLGAWYILHGDLLFHTDIARDFLLIEDIAYNKHITLIGPRSGGISGVFHGPLWLYLNLPAFLLGGGNPVYVGWFWFILYLSLLVIVYKVASKIFDRTTAILSLLVISQVAAGSVRNLFNPFGAVMLSPLFLYFFWRYFSTFRYKYLLTSFFVLGLIIQFQMAFGVPLLLASVLLLAVVLFRKKKLHHFSAALILIIPLSTYILFELKHNFLQVRSVLESVGAAKKPGDQILPVFLSERFKGFFISGLNILTTNNFWLNLPVSLFFFVVSIFVYKNKKIKKRSFYLLFFYFYLTFWIQTFLFRGVIWGYYYWPFLPLAVLVIVSFGSFIDKKLFYLFLAYLLIVNYLQVPAFIKEANKIMGKEGASWQYNFAVAKRVYQDAKGDFGFFIYTPDLFGYSIRYAFNYTQNLFKDRKANPFKKLPLTYTVMAPPPDDKPYLNGDWWRTNQVKITRRPNKTIKLDTGYKIEKYLLSDEEINIPADQNLIQSIYFR